MATMSTFRLVTLALLLALTSSQQSSSSLTFTITEGEPSFSLVGSVSSLNLDTTEAQKAAMSYIFISENVQRYFSLQDKTGDLYTTVVIDKESICPYLVECIMEFRVAATSGEFYQTITVKIIVEDVNDNNPMFPEETFLAKVSEGVTINFSFPIHGATDRDNGVYGIKSYEISPESDTFGLMYEQNLDGSFNVQLLVKKILDREVKDRYMITVLAKDGGNPPNVGTMKVDIQVTDMNDNKPEFNEAIYNISIKEDTEPETVILTILAKDKDSGDNGLVSYKISERQGNVQEIKGEFSVNATSGEVKLKKQLLYQANRYYSFIVEALDNGSPQQVTQAQVLIYVIDAGNNPPKVTISLLSSGNAGFVNISEEAKRGKVAAHITVEDTDTGLNGVVMCNVSDSMFKVDEVVGGGFKVVVDNELDREVKDLYELTVICFDQGSPVLSSSEKLVVRVTDVNDNAPVFERVNYMASIYENMAEIQQILQVSATDKDSGRNKEIHYEIRNQDRISVDPQSGIITAKPYFDREIKPVVIFEVLAIDNGKTAMTGTTSITLTIKDRNDNAPQFLLPSFEFEIEENLNSGTSVGVFLAKDDDFDENGKFTFSISPDYSDAKFPFIIFADGKIQSNRELDREEKSRYDFHVVVTDQGEPPLSSSVTVVVIVNDINDNSPNITFPNKNNKTASILYPDSPADYVTQIKAYDLDSGENKTLTFELVAGNDLKLFKIEKHTGIVSVADTSIMIDQNLRIPLQVKVSDNGPVPRYSTAELVIDLTYTNATYSPVSSDGNKYVVISVVVVVITILISAAIIGVIFLLRCFDRKKALAVKTQSDHDAGFASKQTMFIINPSGESSTDFESGDLHNDIKKKKEVSFSEDHESIMGDIQIVNLPEPLKFAPEKPPRKDHLNMSHDQYDKVATRLENLKYQQYLMEVQAKKHQQAHHTNPEDSRSETSGETNTDSGHGASESDGPSTSPSHDDQKVFDYMIPSQFSKSDNQLVQPVRKDKPLSLSPPPIPTRTYKPYSSFNNNSNYPITPQYASEPSYHSGHGPVTDNSRLSWQPHLYSKYPVLHDSNAQIDYSDYSSLPSYFRGSVKSRDDDDCSTTTSGSYTLQSIEDLL